MVHVIKQNASSMMLNAQTLLLNMPLILSILPENSTNI